MQSSSCLNEENRNCQNKLHFLLFQVFDWFSLRFEKSDRNKNISWSLSFKLTGLWWEKNAKFSASSELHIFIWLCNRSSVNRVQKDRRIHGGLRSPVITRLNGDLRLRQRSELWAFHDADTEKESSGKMIQLLVGRLDWAGRGEVK